MHADIDTRPKSAGIVAGRRIADALFSRITSGTLTVTLPDGEQTTYRGSGSGPVAAMRVHRYRFFRRFIVGGAVGFAESYLEGDWDTEDLVAVIELGACNQASLSRTLEGGVWARALNRALHLLRRNSRRGARRNIAAHYDLGNDFYRLWLDATMTYSAGLFDHPGDDLGAAQARKYARMAELADLRPEHRVLEIGCGWGGFGLWAAGEIGCRVTAVTISREQYDCARRRVAEAGLADRVDLRLQDYRDVAGRYDRIVSIEMLEAVGERYWPVFFETLRERLAPGGRAALQVITIDDAEFAAYRDRVDFIQRYIFPGGMLPAPSVLSTLAAHAGLEWTTDADRGIDYAHTLAHWRARFEQAWPRVSALGFDGRFRRLWRYYLAYCEAGFRTGRIGLMQMALRRPDLPA